MLTLILLVVLGGGVGILAVSMAERKPATNLSDSRRARPADDDAATDAGPGAGPGEDPGETATAAPEPEVLPEPEPLTIAVAPAPVSTPPSPAPPERAEPHHDARPARRRDSGPERRLHRGDVPRSQTAVEGELGDLLRPSMLRRITSLVGVVLIVVVVGVGIAAFLGAIVGGVAELFGNAI